MKVVFKEKTIELAEPKSVYDAAAEAELISRAVLGAEVNGELCALTKVIDTDAEVKLLTFEDEGGQPDAETGLYGYQRAWNAIVNSFPFETGTEFAPVVTP